jgi:excisionase family DNA binding protein
MPAKEAAEYLGISYWLLLELAKKKQIPHFKLGGRVMFRTDTLDLWIKNQEAISISQPQSPGFGQLRRIEG